MLLSMALKVRSAMTVVPSSAKAVASSVLAPLASSDAAIVPCQLPRLSTATSVAAPPLIDSETLAIPVGGTPPVLSITAVRVSMS